MLIVEKGRINIHNSINIKTRWNRWIFYHITPYTLEFYLLIAINTMITYLFYFFIK